VVSEFKPHLDESDFVVSIVETIRGEGGVSNLFEADVIVTGGRGAIEDSLELIKSLVEEFKNQGINAEWACSRPVVDQGISEYARQIGQTGKTLDQNCISRLVFQVRFNT